MKKSTFLLLLTIMLFGVALSSVFSQTVEITANNLVNESANSMTFDVWIKNNGATSWDYASAQYVFTFNAAIANGGTLAFVKVAGTSQLNSNVQPGNTTVNTASGRLQVASNISAQGNTFAPNTSLRVFTFRLTTTAGSFSAVNPIIVWKQSLVPYTIVSWWNGAGATQFTVGNKTFVELPDVPLPIKLASFNGTTFNKRDVKLTWKTTQEVNNHGFDVERKITGAQQWSKVAFVNGFGNSSTPITYNYEDLKLNTGKYSYRLKQIDNNGNFEYFELNTSIEVGVPTKFDISQNYPNPFNPTTKVDFDLPFDSKVSIMLYDMTGREVKTLVNETRTAGYHTIQFNASDLSSGTYFYRIITKSSGKDFVMTKKMMLVK